MLPHLGLPGVRPFYAVCGRLAWTIRDGSQARAGGPALLGCGRHVVHQTFQVSTGDLALEPRQDKEDREQVSKPVQTAPFVIGNFCP